jgi:hypothetical protein
MTELRVGDRTVALPELNGFKAVRAARLVAEVMTCAPQVNDKLRELRQDYGDANALVVTPALAKLPRFQRTIVDEDGNEREVPIFTPADFEAAGGEIRIPQDPPMAEQIVAIFPVVWTAAEQQVIELLALLISPNSELADADEDGSVDDYLTKSARRLLHAATLDQLVELAVASIEQVVNALTKDGGNALERAMGAMTGSAPKSANRTEPSTQESSTDSAEPTDGADETASTERLGQKSENSLSG